MNFPTERLLLVGKYLLKQKNSRLNKSTCFFGIIIVFFTQFKIVAK
jgi:hypothetical protein